MKFIAIVTRHKKKPLYTADREELQRISFEAPSIMAGKRKATKITKSVVLLKGKRRWNGKVKDITGRELRWQAWETPDSYIQENGKEVGMSCKRSEKFTDTIKPTPEATPRLQECDCYFAYLTLYWEIQR